MKGGADAALRVMVKHYAVDYPIDARGLVAPKGSKWHRGLRSPRLSILCRQHPALTIPLANKMNERQGGEDRPELAHNLPG